MRRAATALACASLLGLALAGCARTARDDAALDADADARARTAAKTAADLDAADKASATPLALPERVAERPRAVRSDADPATTDVAAPAIPEPVNLQD